MQRDRNDQTPDKTASPAQMSPEAEARLAAAAARREQRLARALRENLKKRKAQIRDRAAQPAQQDTNLALLSGHSSFEKF